MAEICGYCKRPVKEIGHTPCQGRHSAKAHAEAGDTACAQQVEEQGWDAQVPHKVPLSVFEQFGSFHS